MTHRDDILPHEPDATLFESEGILVTRRSGRINVVIAGADLEDLAVFGTTALHGQFAGCNIKHAYFSGNRTETTYLISNVLGSTRAKYNVVKEPVTWAAFRRDPAVREGVRG